MGRIRKRLAEHRVATYCIVTFALTWVYWFATVYPRALLLMEAGKSVFSDSITVMLVGAGMLFPALGVVVTRLLTGEGFRSLWIKPVRFRRTWKYYVAGWLGPIALVAAGGVVYFLLNPEQFDPSMTGFVEMTQRQLETVGQPVAMDASQIRMIGYAQLALGHNYGLGYPGWPVLGIAAMCCFCVALSCLFSWLTLRAESCLPAVLAHGAMNGCAAAPTMFLVGTASPFIGPTATGIIGGIGFIVVAALCLVSLRKGQPEGK